MNKPDVSKILKNVRIAATKHSPEILTGLGIASMFTMTVLAVKETPKALKCIDDTERKKDEKLTAVETVKACWKCYVPAAIAGAVGTGCLIGASSVNARRNAALAAAYKLSEAAIAEYREQVINTIGEKKEELVREAVDKKRLEKKPLESSEIIITDKGTARFFDPISGRRFESSRERIKAAENELNKRMLHDMFGYVSLNEFYDEIGLPRTSQGDDLGWNLTKGMIDVHLSAQIDEDGQPCGVIDFYVAPRYDYDRFS